MPNPQQTAREQPARASSNPPVSRGGVNNPPASSQSSARQVPGRTLGSDQGTTPRPDDAVATGPKIKVRATATGYYGDARRRAGDVFLLYPRKGDFDEVVKNKDGDDKLSPNNTRLTKSVHKTLSAEEQFNPKWMEKVGSATPERVTGANQALRKQHDDEMRARHTPPGQQSVDIDNPTGGEDVLGDDADA